jgi:hypothetical protein
MKRLIIFILMAKCLFSCGSGVDLCNRTEAKQVLENFSREYTGLNTLIRTDGYYYHEDSTGLLHEPFIMSNNGELHILYIQYKSHVELQGKFRNNTPTGRGIGSYTLSDDTIIVRWAMPFQFNCYDVFSGQYVIENDTTLRKIWQQSRNGQRNLVRNEIYRFYEYEVN